MLSRMVKCAGSLVGLTALPWMIIFWLSGLWALDATYRGYHAISSDTGYISLRALATLVLVETVLHAGVLGWVTSVSRRAARAGFAGAVIVDNLLWMSMLWTRNGLRDGDDPHVLVGYYYAVGFVLLPTAALLVGIAVAWLTDT